MARHHGPVLVDTNVILESHRVGSWRALTGGYRVETVEDCVTETQTGFQKRRPERLIDAGELCASLAAVHPVADRERAELAVRVSDIALDRGEVSLWAHALRRNDAWVLCGPDKASLRLARSARISRAAGVIGRTSRRRGPPAETRVAVTVHKEMARQNGWRVGSGGGIRAVNHPPSRLSLGIQQRVYGSQGELGHSCTANG